ncbi:MAG: chorismate-binding protein [Planctomycetota bacterium]|jgi:anthranilate synthase component 1|nr:chorismate-binding protein [Planctomycetota bacterium]
MANPSLRTDGVIRMLPGERFTPFALARKLNARILFESSSFERGRSRYSLLVLDEAFRLIQRGPEVLFRAAGEAERPFASAPARDILDAAAWFANQHPALHQDFPYPCGGFGYVGYEFAARCDAVRLAPKPDDIGIDDAAFLFGHVYLIYDHHADIIYLHGVNYHERQTDLKTALDAAERRIRDLDFNYLAEPESPAGASLIPDPEGEREFLAGVASIKRDIEAGSLIQAVLSRRIEVETDRSSLDSYRRLRSINPSPYMFHIDFGDFQLFGASPEMHVRLKEGRLTIKPLAGTRPRRADPAANAELERELLADEKERAEHMMLVDLARNDLGRVARIGSVKVADLMSVEHYSHVMHLSSRVEAELAAAAAGLDAIRLSFPAGTVSGAPKIRAMETLDRLERRPRRFYSGLVGFIEPDGDFNTCIAIRCALQKGRKLWLQAGAGIVHDSIPERELAETNHKLGALLAALGQQTGEA